jgi:hypothetical protein
MCQHSGTKQETKTMKTEIRPAPSKTGIATRPGDSAKLMSLLALAAGATAMPQTGKADLVYTNLTSPVVIGTGTPIDSFTFALPGTAQMGFHFEAHHTGTTLAYNYFRTIKGPGTGALAGLAQAGGFVIPKDKGAAWSAPGGLFYNVFVGSASALSCTPTNGYAQKYLAFGFSDTTQGGASRYGWVEVSLGITTTTPTSGGPELTILSYAYDNSGGKPALGVVPEPGSASLLAMGALVLGARGVRSWRKTAQARTARERQKLGLTTNPHE